jgi:glutamate dehydrogenase
MAQKQFDRSADLLGLDKATRAFLRIPMREYQFSLPVFLDNGETQVLRAFTVQFNDARGPTKGGVRFHPSETVDTIRALAMWMTWKCAVMNLPLGGSSSGVACDPHSLSPIEMERICRGFVRRIAHFTGPIGMCLGPDIMTGPQQMLWMLDEYESIHNQKSPGFITGKPITHAGSKGRKEACGYGAMVAVREALKDLGVKLEDTAASFQGFGTTGQHAAKLYHQMGGKIMCVSCWDQVPTTSPMPIAKQKAFRLKNWSRSPTALAKSTARGPKGWAMKFCPAMPGSSRMSIFLSRPRSKTRSGRIMSNASAAR